eukprot:7216460-Pyramimonas_sp.AAC.1
MDGSVILRTSCPPCSSLVPPLPTAFLPLSPPGVFAALVGPNTFFPVNVVCKKQTVVSHSSTKSEIVALDSAL